MMKGKDGLNSEARTGSIDPAWSEIEELFFGICTGAYLLRYTCT
jgi:hypothetical protein